ncbi:hypothetical protein SISNIDRAFT_482325 [Sistotremastrum niveocremeum HHB9708]|uniref:Uncharacterized protein n=1 Tax=Sistotremastrum niveocremeum HHB9708 TaxID=1314777 RepID=A0A164Z0L7_9AGAM|nr:hypothetical protein SISNIDRAFT_482325 [Sistotremastrum niveocremeum HHB9708]
MQAAGKSEEDLASLERRRRIAFIAFGTAAFAVPLLVLRRSRLARTRSALSEDHPPIRASASSSETPLAPRAALSRPSAPATPTLQTVKASKPTPKSTAQIEDDGFNAPLHSLGAFGAASAIVGLSAFAGIWAFRQAWGIQTFSEFGQRMRRELAERMPVLSSIMARSNSEVMSDESSETGSVSHEGEEQEWTWEESKARLSRAYDEGGFQTWLNVAVKEMDKEARTLLNQGRDVITKPAPEG